MGFEDSMSEQGIFYWFDIIGNMRNLKKYMCAIAVWYTGYLSLVCNSWGQAVDKMAIQTTSKRHNHGMKYHISTFVLTPSHIIKSAPVRACGQCVHTKNLRNRA